MAARKDRSDPLWDTRRKRLDRSLIATGVLMLLSMLQGTDMAAVVIPPGFIFAGMIIGAYFGVAGYERIHGGTTVTEEVIERPPGPTITTTKTTEKVSPEGGE